MMPLAPSYEYSISDTMAGTGIELWHTTTGESKTFFIAGDMPRRICEHMDSLTESQCDQFVTVKVAKKKDKKA